LKFQFVNIFDQKLFSQQPFRLLPFPGSQSLRSSSTRSCIIQKFGVGENIEFYPERNVYDNKKSRRLMKTSGFIDVHYDNFD